MDYKILADFHVHTISSLHALSTVNECLEVARTRDLKYVAITDHYYNHGDELEKKNELARLRNFESHVQNNSQGIEVIGGAEFNIAQPIYKWEKLRQLNWKIIGCHAWFLDRERCTLDELYNYFLKASEEFDAFAHIERELDNIENCKYNKNLNEQMKRFLSDIVILAKKKNIYLELNEASLQRNRDGCVDRLLYWLELAKDNGNYISLGSDAHFCQEVGNFAKTVELLRQIEYPQDLILNCNVDLIKKILKK